MTALVERAHEIGSAFPSPAVSRIGMTKMAAIKSKLSASWPPALIVLGLILTLGWNAGLLWLVYELV
jgi:hypothetical protein